MNPAVSVHALTGINLLAQPGDRVGVIGHNGAGKSTLLRTLAGIYPPSSGAVDVQGKISSLFDIALGFEMDATGWENISYRGYLQGETPQTIRAKLQPIADFTELGRRTTPYTASDPWVVEAGGRTARFVRVRADSKEPRELVLTEIEVFAKK